MAALTWTTLQTTLLAALSKAQPPYNVVPPDFAALYPQATSYAEQRIYRDLVLLATRTQDLSQITVSGSRTISLSAMFNPIIVLERIELVMPAGSVPAFGGTKYAYDKSSLDVIDLVWPQLNVTMAPSAATWIGRRWAMLNNDTVVISPTPDAGYRVAATGLFQPTPIGPTNTTTYLSTQYPDLLTAACMVFLTGALTHNFGSQGDLPAQAVSWESQYAELKASALHEEMRRRGLSPDIAQPPEAAPAGGSRQ